MSFHVSRYKAKAAELGENFFYKVYYKRYLRQTIKEPIRDVPAAVSKAAVKKVWSRYCAVDPRWMQYYTMMNGIASPYYIPSDVWFARICRTLNRRTLFRYPMLQDKNYLDMLFSSPTPSAVRRSWPATSTASFWGRISNRSRKRLRSKPPVPGVTRSS